MVHLLLLLLSLPTSCQDHDLVLSDPEKILDHATYEQPSLPSPGIHHVLVNGIFIVKNGQLQETAHSGQPSAPPSNPGRRAFYASETFPR
jgi:N-acyl-D-aspartate/D-glutamate deacylase